MDRIKWSQEQNTAQRPSVPTTVGHIVMSFLDLTESWANHLINGNIVLSPNDVFHLPGISPILWVIWSIDSHPGVPVSHVT